MHLHCTCILLLCGLIVLGLPVPSKANIIDALPIFSQLKSLFQVIAGDAEGARRTQENFLDTAPGVSQVKSAVQAAQGDTEGARRTQEKFVKVYEQVIDDTPVIGHIKGAIHMELGDQKRGEEIMKGASRTMAVATGAFLGGPLGAITAGISYDGLVTVIDSAANKQDKPYGIIDYVANIGSQSSGDHFDQFLGIVFDGLEGRKAKGSNTERKNGKGPEGTLDEGIRRQPDEGNGNYGMDRLPDDMDIDLDELGGASLEGRRRGTGLPDSYAQRLEDIDFRDINDMDGNMNCYYCTAAAFRGLTVTELVTRSEIMMEALGTPTPEKIVEVFRDVGFPQTRILFQGVSNIPSNNIGAFHAFLNAQLRPGQSASFALAFRQLDPSTGQGFGHVVLMRTWKEPDGSIRYLITDFQQPVESPHRFSTSLPYQDQLIELYIIHPQSVTAITDMQINGLLEAYQGRHAGLMSASGEKSCAKKVIGYVTSWSAQHFTIQQSLHLTHAIYAFFSMNASGHVTMPQDITGHQRWLDLMIAKKAHQARGLDMKVLFAVGGWENSQYFSEVAADDGKRRTFVNSVLAAIRNYNFDGVDIDWEYPVTGGAKEGIYADKENYVRLLRELRRAFDAEQRSSRLLLTIASAAGETALEKGYDLEQIVDIVDWISVMSYDFFGAWESEWGAFVGPNAPLYHAAPPRYSGKLNVDWALKQYVCQTKKPQKIVMGLPFYGRYWFRTNESVNAGYDLFRLANKIDGKYGGDKSFKELSKTMLNDSNFDLRWDEKSKTPWALHRTSKLVLTYDNQESIKLKVNYAIEKNLGGVMVWSVDQDDQQMSLLSTISSNVCIQGGNRINYKCSPLKERRWWTWAENKTNAGKCGMSVPLYKGYYPRCDPDDPGYHCCGKHGFCGSGREYCNCPECIDYARDPNRLIEEPIRPSQAIQWHVGFDVVQPAQPRCGKHAPLINNKEAICNPDDRHASCCSQWGYCGSGPEFCNCPECVDYAKHPNGKQRVPSRGSVQWHVGFDVVKPGAPRCGNQAPKINGRMAICDPGSPDHCCSKWGYCGSGPNFCNCDGCLDSRNL